ncbi:hypothetical protein C2S53_017839 [Perilla frutescens var. hirtella]|uniref:R3H domain-containing protein 2 n=1 Tax=Perilla frutescens var. hirtella TaxID=608512 RepID=A0AAD4IM41_PERFH|nr:hypothetical protein C2S53_017839 [Perilla frutescens var. hirtella]
MRRGLDMPIEEGRWSRLIHQTHNVDVARWTEIAQCRPEVHFYMEEGDEACDFLKVLFDVGKQEVLDNDSGKVFWATRAGFDDLLFIKQNLALKTNRKELFEQFMEGSAAAPLASVEDGPESWEVADVEASMRRLMHSSRKESSNISSNKQEERVEESGPGLGVSDNLINTVDQFLREAIQNPRERLSVLRMEQDVEKFIRDPTREQMEFQQLPTSYLRLAAHRVAQHYSLQSMVLLDNNLLEGSGSKIIVRKTSSIRLPLIRLADIPVNLPNEDTGAIKVAIKQRPQKGAQGDSHSGAHSGKSNSSKSVEERKEEYSRARARIFSSNNSSGSSTVKQGSDGRIHDNFQHGSLGLTKAEERSGGSDGVIARSLSESSTSSSRLPRSRTEKEPIGRPKTNSRVAIFRDREVDRKDPDYDRNYDRYMQRFDPGFGFSGGPYSIQPMYAPAMNYNTEFPQLGSGHMPPISSEHQPRPLPQHLPGPWIASSSPAGIGYSPAEMPPFNSGHVNARSNSALYLHSPQYPCQRSGLPYLHPLDPVNQPFSQSHQQQPDASFGLARPRHKKLGHAEWCLVLRYVLAVHSASLSLCDSVAKTELVNSGSQKIELQNVSFECVPALVTGTAQHRCTDGWREVE